MLIGAAYACNRAAPWSGAIGSGLVTSAWTYLIVAGLFEVGWPIGLKWAQ
jgi:hypothetical protein